MSHGISVKILDTTRGKHNRVVATESIPQVKSMCHRPCPQFVDSPSENKKNLML